MPKFDAALNALAEKINATEDELAELRAAYVKLGGVFEDEDGGESGAEDKEPPKRLAAPSNAASGEADIFRLNGHRLELTAPQVAALELMRDMEGEPVHIDTIAGLFGGSKPRMYEGLRAMRDAVSLAGHDIENVRGLGYRLVKA